MMTPNELIDTFEFHQSEFLRFDRVDPQLNTRRDLHAMLFLAQMFEGNYNNSSVIISDADHDVIYFNVDIEEFRSSINVEDIIDLIRCGVIYDSHHDTLKMGV